MSEIAGRNEPTLKDPELLSCQAEIKWLCDEVLALKPERIRLTHWDIPVQVDPEEVQQRLRDSSINDLVLKNGDTLSSPTKSKYHPELNLFVGKAQLESVTMRAWGWEYDKQRIDPNGPKKPPYSVIEYPGEKDWTRQLDISLHYTNGQQIASQTITIQTDSMHAGEVPSISRDVSAMAYAEMGYEGHNQVWRSCKDAEEASAFITLARELYASYQPPTE